MSGSSSSVIAGNLYLDVAASGKIAPSNQEVGGFVVDLYSQNGQTLLATTTTDSAGNYAFTNLAAGSYDLVLHTAFGFRAEQGTVLPDGFSQISGLSVDGTNTLTFNQGFYYAGSISGAVVDPYGDAATNGLTVQLLQNGGVVAQTTTGTVNGQVGAYSFTGLAVGTYQVSVLSADVGAFAGVQTGTVTISASNLNGVAAASNAVLAPYMLQTENTQFFGQVFTDANGNGVGDADEVTGGVAVTLTNSAGQIAGTATTASNGGVAFGSLQPGEYSVTITPPAGYSVADGPSVYTQLVGDSTPFFYQSFLLAPTSQVAPSLSGTVFLDANDNGVPDAGESGVAGANVLLINGSGKVVEVATTDGTGAYTFANVEAGTGYKILVAPPAGYAGATGPTAEKTGITVVGGQSLSGETVGLVTAAATNQAEIPATRTINIVLAGQSNTYYSTVETQPEIDPLTGQAETVTQAVYTAQQVAYQLGYSDVTNTSDATGGVRTYIDGQAGDGKATVNLVTTATEYIGTALTVDWLRQNGTYQSGWTVGSIEKSYLSALDTLAQNSPAGTPTAILTLHNENDSMDGVTTAEWTSAMQYQASVTRAVLGLTPAQSPYFFISPIPFDTSSEEPVSNQSIAVGQAILASDPSFDGHVAARETSDVDMNHDGAYSSAHLNVPDREAVYGRAALGIAQAFASSALPGSPIALATGHAIDSQGPQVVAIDSAATNPALAANQLLLTVTFDDATSLDAALNQVAADGTGWSLRQTYLQPTADATGTAAAVVGTNQLLLTFDADVGLNDRLFYNWGGLRLNENDQTGQHAAIYDNNGLPLSTDPTGLPVASYRIQGPTISGTTAGQTTSLATPIAPFGGVTLSDSNTTATETIVLTLTGNAGTLTGAGLIQNNDGTYTLAGPAATVTAQLRALQFVATPPTSGTYATTSFQITDMSSAYVTPATDGTTTVVDLGPPVAPTISGTVAGQTTTADAPVKPFSTVTIGDQNYDATETLTIAVSAGAGTLSGPGLTQPGGSYTLSGTAAAVTTALQGLTFTPATGSPGTSSTATFTLSDTSSAYATPTTDATTTVVDSDPARAPTITGTLAGQTTTSEVPLVPFAHVAIGDPNAQATDTLTIAVSGAVGTLTGGSGLTRSGNTYTLTGSAASVTTALDALTFTPTAGVANSSATTTFALSDTSSAYSASVTDSTTTVIDADPAAAPVIAGTVAGQHTTSEAPIRPFADVTVRDPNADATDTLTIAVSGSGGTLTGGAGLVRSGNSYTLTGSSASITTALEALSFAPTAGVPGSTSTTTFGLSDVSSAYSAPAVDTTTTVIDTDPAGAPSITGAVAGQTTKSEAPIKPFAAVTISDPNANATETLTISLAGAGGTLSGGSGLVQAGNGYTLTGSAGAVTTALDALTFTPAAGAPNTSSTTTFTLSDVSSAFPTPTTNATTTVVNTDPASTGSGTGDVHMVTFNGVHYDFQATGDYTLETSTVAGDTFDVQIRASAWANMTSVTTQVAAQVGANAIDFNLDGSVDVNGAVDPTLGAGAPGTSEAIDGGHIARMASNAFAVTWDTGERLSVTNEGGYFNETVSLGPNDGPGSVAGLLGTNTSAASDIQLSNGTILDNPSASDIVGAYAKSWSVAKDASLLDGSDSLPLAMSKLGTAAAPFDGKSSIDLANVNAATATLAFSEDPSGAFGTLGVTSGAQHTALLLVGQFAATNFGVASDGHGGTTIDYQPPKPTLLAHA